MESRLLTNQEPPEVLDQPVPVNRFGPLPLLAIILGLLLLLLGPVFVGSLLHSRETETISRASDRLASLGVLEAINQASRDIALMVEPSSS